MDFFIIEQFLFLDGAIDALSGWTEMNNGRGNVRGISSSAARHFCCEQASSKRSNNKSGNKSSSQTPPPNTILRPSQRVSNIFQTFAEGGIPTTASSLASSFAEQTNPTLQSYPSTDLTFHPYLSQGRILSSKRYSDERRQTFAPSVGQTVALQF